MCVCACVVTFSESHAGKNRGLLLALQSIFSHYAGLLYPQGWEALPMRGPLLGGYLAAEQ